MHCAKISFSLCEVMAYEIAWNASSLEWLRWTVQNFLLELIAKQDGQLWILHTACSFVCRKRRCKERDLVASTENLPCLVPRRLSLKRARKGRREGDNALRLPSVPFPWSLAVHHQSLVSRSPLPCEKRSAWGGGWFSTLQNCHNRLLPTERPPW